MSGLIYCGEVESICFQRLSYPVRASALTWVDFITSRRADIRCRSELGCQLQSNVKPRINNWPRWVQLGGIKEQRRNRKSPRGGRSKPNTCTGWVLKGRREQEIDVSGQERLSHSSFTRGRRRRARDLLEDLLRTQGTKKKWQHHGRRHGDVRRARCRRLCTRPAEAWVYPSLPRVQPVQTPERSVHSSRVRDAGGSGREAGVLDGKQTLPIINWKMWDQTHLQRDAPAENDRAQITRPQAGKTVGS